MGVIKFRGDFEILEQTIYYIENILLYSLLLIQFDGTMF